jgi:hypothetical protein
MAVPRAKPAGTPVPAMITTNHLPVDHIGSVVGDDLRVYCTAQGCKQEAGKIGSEL